MPESSTPALELAAVSYRYPRASGLAIERVDVALAASAFSSIIGPNGAGKSTLVRLLGGTARPTHGRVTVLGEDLSEWDRTELARTMAVVSQDAPPDALPIDVEGYVELGRNPYVSPWASLRGSDREIVRRAVAWADLEGLEERRLSELSGGERQRAKLARALAQEPDILVLDEPSAHLDFRHALWVFDALKALVRDGGLTVVCITHDMHLASRYSDTLVLLSGGRIVAVDAPGRVLTSPALAAAYECDVRVEALGELGHSVLPVRPRSVAEAAT